jgi:hypothetical protein
MSSDASVKTTEIDTHLSELRQAYVEALPEQRLRVGKLRINNPEHAPNRLIAFVSAAEGFARSLCMHQRARTKEELSALYPEYWKRSAESLIAEYLAAKSLGDPASHFGAPTWQLFGYAVQYRNLLAHECTYLGADRSPELIEACRAVLQTLAKDEGLNADDI